MFYWSWRASEGQLTLTGSYMQDIIEYPDFRADLLVYAEIAKEEEDAVKATMDKLKKKRR